MIDAQLRAQTVALLPADEEVEPVFVGVAGLRPGMAALSIPLTVTAMVVSLPVGIAVGCMSAAFYWFGRS